MTATPTRCRSTCPTRSTTETVTGLLHLSVDAARKYFHGEDFRAAREHIRAGVPRL